MSQPQGQELVAFRQVAWSPPGGEDSVLNGLDFGLKSGEWVALTGPSGAGKTTFLSLAAGLLRPDSGEVTLFGQPLKDCSQDQVAALRRGRIGLVFQGYHLDDSRTVRENILLPGYFLNRPWFELRERTEQLAQVLELSQHLDKPVSVLSGGQRQRVAVARAVLSEPELLLADEPTGALDEHTAGLVLDLLSRQQERGCAILTITHDPKLLDRCSRRLDLKLGQLSGKEVAS